MKGIAFRGTFFYENGECNFETTKENKKMTQLKEYDIVKVQLFDLLYKIKRIAKTKEKEMAMNEIRKKFLKNVIPVLIGIVVLGGIIGAKIEGAFAEGERRVITSSSLKEAINIAELSTAEYRYNGVATVYKNDKKQKVKCYIRYFATVHAFIEADKIEFEIDKENHTVTPILPELEYKINVADEQSLSFMPDNVKIDLNDALEACQQDAMTEATDSGRLKDVAEENLKNTIEALLYPIISYYGYTIEWE